ncbi:MAG: hypothetical protein OQJ99_09610 [Rhodospirillales bacterium]|nr:hypothetical protein [Rhodospirillales bacterium]MCW8861316.1 hypothetical protein [Rhodospirillales bacterium]MCW9003510.1 hypothetical protein [Rhodospirillales bacterium]MCW9040815.1 hypothetical protein [Rhodospirillales bacterium]
MKHLAVAAAAAALLAAGPAWSAVDLHNDDEVSHEVTITENGKDRVVVLKGGDGFKGVCAKACIFRLKGGNTVEASGNDVFWVANGELVAADD